MSYVKTITTIPSVTKTAVGIGASATDCIALDLINLDIYKEAYVEFWEDTTLIFTIYLNDEISLHELLDSERLKYYDITKMYVKTDATACQTITYCICP